MFRTADRPARLGDANGLVGRLAQAERDAFTARHQTLAPDIAAPMRSSPPSSRSDRLAPFHTAPDTAVPARTAGVADRRASERRRADDEPAIGSGARPSAPSRMCELPDRRSQPDLAALLGQHLPTGPPARHQTSPTAEASPT